MKLQVYFGFVRQRKQQQRQACFVILTVKPGSDVAPYRDRQIVIPESPDGWNG
jgi:putative SOS response-associated peptidase YedK